MSNKKSDFYSGLMTFVQIIISKINLETGYTIFFNEAKLLQTVLANENAGFR
jgi:hypothetical protein